MKKTKNTVLLVSGIGGGIVLTFLLIVLNNFCGANKIICKDIYTQSASYLFLFPLVFIFSLITYFIREEIFRSWIKFTYIWIPISIFLVLFIPGGGGNSAFPSLIDKELVSIFMSGLYFSISLIIVIFGSVKYYYFKK